MGFIDDNQVRQINRELAMLLTHRFDDPFVELFRGRRFCPLMEFLELSLFEKIDCVKCREYTTRLNKQLRYPLFIFSFIRLSITEGTRPSIAPPSWKTSFTKRELT
jgi:hypothetical protein